MNATAPSSVCWRHIYGLGVTVRTLVRLLQYSLPSNPVPVTRGVHVYKLGRDRDATPPDMLPETPTSGRRQLWDDAVIPYVCLTLTSPN